MAELTIKIKPDDIAERVIDDVAYKGKTTREWADLLTNPKTNADRIRAMSDEGLAHLLVHNPWMTEKSALDWLKQEAQDD